MNRTALAQRTEKLSAPTDSEQAGLLKLLREENGPAARTYGLFWENKPEQVEECLRDKLPVLQEAAERRITEKPMPVNDSGGRARFPLQAPTS